MAAENQEPEEHEQFTRARQAVESLDGPQIIALAIAELGSANLALVSSFGAEAAVLLSLVAEVDPQIAVLFLETHKHFPETLDYRDRLVARLGLRNLRIIEPEAAEIAQHDPTGMVWKTSPDRCCELRKVMPLERVLAEYRGWFNGRKRYQSTTRAAIPKLELDGSRFKFNPLADWDRERIAQEFARRDLPHHPLEAYGYLSIGCAPCTRAVEAGSVPRAGRWATADAATPLKLECGIHH
ncbi:MAG: phosphoadenylyl-sulfate reductase [Alphaproteobacteria bacterium]|nr:phosphoadenylyl-sulfate reductase [Alphaproteobacteria bacterium]